ncbi:MAG: 4Fe-4S dicluster domain-containing protein [Ruminococcaceae bacterium]|nr:4Fe-4S dicluster domain-containing protein [Oscillospiraceae bacterium]
MGHIVSDNDRCVGCLACVVTCMDHHFAAEDHNAVSFRTYKAVDLSKGLTQYLTDSCRHCADAPCIDACPVSCISRDNNGWTKVDRDECVGCRACLNACPYALPVFDAEGKSRRCDGCMACVQVCPNGALRLGE